MAGASDDAQTGLTWAHVKKGIGPLADIQDMKEKTSGNGMT